MSVGRSIYIYTGICGALRTRTGGWVGDPGAVIATDLAGPLDGFHIRRRGREHRDILANVLNWAEAQEHQLCQAVE